MMVLVVVLLRVWVVLPAVVGPRPAAGPCAVRTIAVIFVIRVLPAAVHSQRQVVGWFSDRRSVPGKVLARLGEQHAAAVGGLVEGAVGTVRRTGSGCCCPRLRGRLHGDRPVACVVVDDYLGIKQAEKGARVTR